MSRTTEPVKHAVRAGDAPASPEEPLNKSLIAKWSLWSWGNATVSAVMTTFVFGTYLTSPVFDPAGLPEGASPGDRGAQYLAVATAVAGAVVALTAPVIGQRTDKAGRRRLWLTLNTVMVITMVALCFFVRPEEGYLLLGVTLMALMGIFDEFANLNYNAMITDISDHDRMGRVSGIGWGAGYMGGIVLLLLVYVGMIEGDWLGIGSDDAVNIRAVALVAAAWHLLFALPLLLTKLKTADKHDVQDKVSVAESYRRLFRVIGGLWREDRNTLWFLLSSAIYRDGLSAVFVWGAVLGVHVYRIEDANIPFTEMAGSVLLLVLPAMWWPPWGHSLAGGLTTGSGPVGSSRSAWGACWASLCSCGFSSNPETWGPYRCPRWAHSGCSGFCCACSSDPRRPLPERSWDASLRRPGQGNCSASMPRLVADSRS